MNYFLQDVAEYLYRHRGSEMRNTCVVFPNRRARLFFNHFLSRLSSEPQWAPRYFTISDFVRSLSGRELADPFLLMFRLFEAFKKVTGSTESFDTFYFYCQMILDDFDDIDKYLIPADKLYRNLNDLKALEDYYDYLEESQINTLREFWAIFNQTAFSDEKKAFISIWDALHRIYLEFNARLDSEELAYEGKLYRQLISDLQSDKAAGMADGPVAFVGFNALNRAEELLFDFFRKKDDTLFFWDFDEDYIKPSYHEAGFFLRKYLKRFPPPADFILTRIPGTEQSVTTLSVPSNIAQAKVVGYALEMVNAGMPSGPLDTAVILADERLLIPVVSSLPSAAEKLNISLGYPITDTPAYGLVEHMARLQRSGISKQNVSRAFHTKDLLNLYHHELLKDLTDQEALEQFEKDLIDHNRLFLAPEEIPLTDPVSERLRQPVNTAAEYISWLKDMLRTVGLHIQQTGDNNRSAQWQMEVLVAIHRIFTRLEGLLTDSGIELSLPVAQNLVYKMLSAQSVPFTGEPLEGLQVLGILETRTLDFKNLVVLSMNEGNFPKTGHAPSFIPFALRESFGLPTIRHQDAIYSYYFYRMLHRSENIVLVYNTLTEGIQKGEPSRFIQQLRYESVRNIAHMDMGYDLVLSPVRGIRAVRSRDREDAFDRKLADQHENYISPSAINTFLSCKLKFYFRYVEQLREPGSVDEKVEADVFGRIFHKSLKLLYEHYEDKQIMPEDIRQMLGNEKLMDSVVDQAFNTEYFHEPQEKPVVYKGRNLIIRSVIRSYATTILQYDIRHAPFRIVSLERDYYRSAEGQEAIPEIRVGGYIDRIDDKDGVIRIIDYKTGRGSLKFKGVGHLFSGDKPYTYDAVRQSLIYSWIYSHSSPRGPVRPALFFVRDMAGEDYDPRLIDASGKRTCIDAFEPMASEFEDALSGVLREIISKDTEFTQTAHEDYCRYCPYASICLRKKE